MAPGDLQEVLAVLKPAGTPPADLLVGLDAADDARLPSRPRSAIVETGGFFRRSWTTRGRGAAVAA